jgi:hypothetical protein
MTTLILPLKRKWFDQIRAGTKPLEFRLKTDYWTKRLVGKSYDRVAFTLGYPKRNERNDMERRIEAPYRGYVETTVVSEEWGNVPQEVFAILTPCHP